jgi:tRNA A58 N-methylase Trm61
VEHLKGKLSEGDDVVIVGGGWGVTAVTAAREVGPEGSVTVYEPNVECYRKCEKVVAANGAADVGRGSDGLNVLTARHTAPG